MIGKLISIAGMMGMSLLCILFGHKWRRKIAVKRIQYGCQVCGGTGAVPCRPEQSAVPMYKMCEACKGSGEDPNNPTPKPPDGLSRRERKQWQREHKPERAEWLKDKRRQKVVWPNCCRCGKENPNWKDPENMKPEKEDRGGVWNFLRWLVDTFGDE